jgi:hypothetical protein
MRLFVPVALLLATAACTDYGFSGAEKPPETPAETGEDPGRPDGPGRPPECPAPEVGALTSSIDESCEVEWTAGTFTPVIEWRDSSMGDSYATPVVGQLTDDDGNGVVNEDDIPDIVVVGTGGNITAVSGDGTGRHWQVSGYGSEPPTAAIGDVTGDGWPDVVVAGNNAIDALDGRSGAVLWRNTDNGLGTLLICGGVGVYDLEADGVAEVVFGNVIIDGRNGTIRGRGAHGKGTGHSSPYAAFGVAADVTGDGVLEVVVGNALYDASGVALWYNGQPDGFVAVANFDADPQGEIVVTTYPGVVRLQDDDGTVLWSGPFTGSTIGPPTVADFDGDGAPEIGVAGNNVYVVIETDGTLKWSQGVNDASSGFTGSAVFDFEGDGRAEVVYADEDNVWVFDGATGSVKLQETNHSSATCSEYPVVADVDQDDHAEIVFTSSRYSGSESGVTVIGDADSSWVRGRTVWNQHAYNIVNIENDSLLPSVNLPNWPSYNNFRSGDVSAVAGNSQGDAMPYEPDICTVECEAGHLYVTLRVANGGTAYLPENLKSALYTFRGGSWSLLTVIEVPYAIPPGATSEGFVVDLDPADVPAGRLLFVVDDDGEGHGQVDECHEDNNTLEITEGLCP